MAEVVALAPGGTWVLPWGCTPSWEPILPWRDGSSSSNLEISLQACKDLLCFIPKSLPPWWGPTLATVPSQRDRASWRQEHHYLLEEYPHSIPACLLRSHHGCQRMKIIASCVCSWLQLDISEKLCWTLLEGLTCQETVCNKASLRRLWWQVWVWS